VTEEIDADASISMGLQPRGYTVWVNGPHQCRIRISGLTEEMVQALRNGLLDITADAKKLAVDKILAFLVERGDHGELCEVEMAEFMDTIRPGFLSEYNTKTLEE